MARRARAAAVIAIRGLEEPRLRFDRTALSLVSRLQAGLGRSVPAGKTVVVTVTAPIRQDSKTGAALEEKIRRLLATRRVELKTTIHGNRIQVRVFKGGGRKTRRLIGFVHNPEPKPTALFEVARLILACLDSQPRSSRGERSLLVDNRHGRAPLGTIRQVCRALRVRSVFRRTAST